MQINFSLLMHVFYMTFVIMIIASCNRRERDGEGVEKRRNNENKERREK